MPQFNLSFRDEHGNVLRTMKLETRDLETARAAARALNHAWSIEIWHGSELASLVEAADEPGG